MAYPGAEPEVALPRRERALPARVRAAWGALAQAFDALPLERLGLAALAIGVMLRLAAPFLIDLRADGNTYAAMGHAWMLRHEFWMPYGDVWTWGPQPGGHSQHYPPAYPLYLGLVYTLFGFGLWQTKVAAVVVALAALAVVYATTRDLYGRRVAALAAGLLALEPHLVIVTGTGFSENMVVLFFALTMWAIVRSLEDERMIVLAGLFAGLCYLSRSSVGYFFFVAGIGGLLWRFHYQRWRLFTNVWYVAAVAVFAAIVAAWAARNVALFGWRAETVTLPLVGLVALDVPQWQTSGYVDYVQRYAWAHRDLWAHALVRKLPLFLVYAAWWVLPLLPEARRALRRAREEHTSALLLSVALVWFLAWVISSMFWTSEQTRMYWHDNHRYVLIGLLPLAWLLLREARLERAGTKLRYALLALSLGAIAGASFFAPLQYPDLRAAEALDAWVEPGDEIALDGSTIKYAFYPYLSQPETLRVYGCLEEAPACAVAPEHPAFIVSLQPWEALEGVGYANYTLVGWFEQAYYHGGEAHATVWARDDVAQARAIPQARAQP